VSATLDLTLPELARMMRDLIIDRGYQSSRLGSAVRDYLAWKRLEASARTLVIYEGYLAALCVLLAADDPDVHDITRAMLLAGMAQHPIGSARVVRSAYVDFFGWCEDEYELAVNPSRKLPRGQKRRLEVYDVFDHAEQGRLALATDRMLLPWVQRLRVRCVIDLGARSAELRGLQPMHFDLNERVVVVTGKGDKDRLLPFGDELYRAYMGYVNRPIPNVVHEADGERWREDRKPVDDDFLFFPYGVTNGIVGWTNPRKQLADRAIRYWWEKLAAQANVRYRSLHMNRHTLGTDMSTAGEDLGTIQDWLGHADPKTTKIYVHNSRSRLKQGQQRLDDYRRGQGG
jgi:site-specific recombinase XerD